MFKKPSLITRITIGKLIGFLFGGSSFFLLTPIDPDMSLRVQFAFFFWYITFGAVIGLVGVFIYHPRVKLKLHWSVRGAMMGGWLNLVLVLFIFDLVADFTDKMTGGALTTPYWMIGEGMLLGMFIDFLATKFAGEGPDTVSGDYS